MTKLAGFSLNVNKLTGWIAICNLIIYLTSVSWAIMGKLGELWTNLLNRTDLGDVLVIWFSVCATLFLFYVGYRIIRLHGISRADGWALVWCGVWIGDIAWIHQFYAVR